MTDARLSLTVAPLTDAEWPSELAALKGGFATRLNVYRTMAHDPALLQAWAPLRDHVVLKGGLTEPQRELVILRVGYRWGAAYEWAHHVSRGRVAGLDDARIARAGAPTESWPKGDPDTELLAAVDDLLERGALSPESLAALQRVMPVATIMDVMALVGFYTTLAFLAKSFAVPIEPELADLMPDWTEA